MDARFLSSEVGEGFSSLKGELDEKSVSILSRLDRKCYEEVAKEIQANFTKASLLATRKKIFEWAVAKEQEKGALTTKKQTTDSDTGDRAALLGHLSSAPRLVNRRSKPLIADDILLLVMYAKYPGDPLPEQVLKKPTGKQSRSNEDKESTVPLDTNISEDWSQILSDEEDDDRSDKVDSTTVKTSSSNGKRVERFIVREVSPSESTEPNDPPRSLVVTRLVNTHTSTVDLIHTRTIGTQTTVSEVNHTKGPSDTRNDNATECSDTCARNENVGRSHTRTHSENSLLEYIDGEFEAMKKGSDKKEKGCDKKTSHDPCDRRFREMEGKYDSVMRKVAHLERTHESDLKMLRREMIAKINAMDTPVYSYDNTPTHRNQRRHSESDAISPSEPRYDPTIDPFDSLDSRDESVWDPETCDVYVSTQDSQGTSIKTKATPLHIREEATRENTTRPPAPDVHEGRKTRSSKQPVNRKDEASSAIDPVAPCGIAQNAVRDTQQKIVASQGRNINTDRAKSSTSSKDTSDTSRSDCSCEKQTLPAKANTRPAEKELSNAITASRSATKGPQKAGKQKSSTNRDRSSDSEDNSKRRRLDPNDNSMPSTSTSNDRPAAKTSSIAASGKSRNEPMHEDDSAENSNGKKSFARVVSPGGWLQVEGSHGNDQNKARKYPPIKRAAPTKNKELYVRGMSCANFKLHKDLEEAVRWYCKDRNIYTVHQRVIMYNKDNDSVGIKVVVRGADVEKFMSRGFWPDGISVREWSDEKPSERERCFDNGRSSSEDSN